MLQKWAEEHGERLEELTFFVQGFGNVASWAARFLARAGATLKAVEDVTGAIPNSGGIDPEAFYEHVVRNRGVAGYESGDPIDHRGFPGTVSRPIRSTIVGSWGRRQMYSSRRRWKIK